MDDLFEIRPEKESIRLFQSDFLEFFTHIHPAVVVAIWLPVVLFFLIRAILRVLPGGPALVIPAAFLIGLFLWTFAEYTLHRFVFHYHPRSERGKRIIFLFHGIHHAQPQDKTRLVMPPVVSIPMALIFFGLARGVVVGLLGAALWFDPLFSGFMTGYLAYDLTHYATHHFRMRQPVLLYLKRYHMMHHYKTPRQRFGVSSPLWDIVFGTKPTQ